MADLQTAAEALLYVIDTGNYSQKEYLDAVQAVRDAVNGVVVEAPAAPVETPVEAAPVEAAVDPLAPAPADAEAVSGN